MSTPVDPADTGLGLSAWLAKYSAPEYRTHHQVTMRINRMPGEQLYGEHGAVTHYRVTCRRQVAEAAWGRSIIAVHEKWWPMGADFRRIPMDLRGGMPYFTAREAFAHAGVVFYVELEMVAISIPMQPQMGKAGR